MLIVESLQLAYRAFFKPFKLNEELSETSRYLATNVPIWQVRSGLSSDERRIVVQALIAIVLGAIVWPIASGLVVFWLRDSFLWDNVLFVALASLVLGIVGLLLVGISFGVNMGTAVSLAGSLAAITGIDPVLTLIRTNQMGPVIGVVAFGLGTGLALGLILGLAAIATFTLRPVARWFGLACTVGGGLTLGILFVRVTGRGADEIGTGVILAVFFALGFLTGYFLAGYRRLPFYLIELIWQVGLTALSFLAMKVDNSGRLIRWLYRLSPVRRDELIWFRVWTLDWQLTWLALMGDRQFALEAISKIARSFHQGWAAEVALAAILAHDLRNCKDIPDVARAGGCLSWFPRAIDLPSLALQRTVTLMNEVSQNAEAATRAPVGPGWQINLCKAQTNVEALQDILSRMNRRMTRLLNPIIQRWEGAIEQALKEVPRDVGPVLIENCYICGNPIPPEQAQVFVGREDLFARIQENLSVIHKPTLVLHGQRRTGKTSLLLQLPYRLSADYVPVCVNLQATAPVDGLNRFLYTLAREAVHQADEKRRIALPPVELEDFDNRGTHAFYEWLEQTHQRLGERLLLLALDEFEQIEKAIEEGQMEAAVLDILRHMIQSYSHWLVLLFAGVCTLEEMSHDWHSYFISVRPLQVSYLDLESARQLIQLPVDKYPIHYDEQAVEAILKATHAQPFLVQAVCFELIQHLNSQRRRLAGPFGRVTVDDAQEAIRRTVSSAHPYFSNLWADSNDPERLILANLAYGPAEKIRLGDLSRGLDMTQETTHQAIKHLERRELIERKEREYYFQVPMMRQWIRDEVSLEAVRVASRSPSDVVRGRGQG